VEGALAGQFRVASVREGGLDIDLLPLLRCPRCRRRFSAIDAHLKCALGHQYRVVDGIPRLIDLDWDPSAARLLEATSAAFGDQWVQLGGKASVTMDDLLLHLPTGWGLEIYRGLVLDAGCGMGRYTALVGELGSAVVGLDLSRAVDAAAHRWPHGRFVQADIDAAPFAPETFDMVYSFGVLHHMPNALRGFQRCFDLVRPGGLLLVWVYSDRRGLLRQARRTTRRLAAWLPRARMPVAFSIALTIWFGYLLPKRALRRARRGRLAFYADKRLAQLFVDCHDALAAPTEQYLTNMDCERWLSSLDVAESGYELRRDGSGWLIWARKPAAPLAAPSS
jgi:SAM-dependent methyltransferase